MNDQKAVRMIKEMLNCYGARMEAGLSGEDAEALEQWLTTTCAKAVMFGISQDQASYALRYRYGDDLETHQKCAKAIANMDSSL